jgi:hypothetical protein
MPFTYNEMIDELDLQIEDLYEELKLNEDHDEIVIKRLTNNIAKLQSEINNLTTEAATDAATDAATEAVSEAA